MPEARAQQAAPANPTKTNPPGRHAAAPFLGMLDAVLVESPVEYVFDCAIPRDDAAAAWLWMVRDLAPDLIDIETSADDPANLQALESLMPDLLERANTAMNATASHPEAARRIKTQLGGEEAWERLPAILNTLRSRALLEKAQGFGRAANAIPDDASLMQALQSMPLSDQGVTAILMMAMTGQVANPSRLVMAAIRLSGGATENTLMRAGFAPLIDAILAHAQNQIPALSQFGTFGDMDKMCRAIDRFHRLVRAVNGYVELNRGSRWSMVTGNLTKAVSERIDPKLRDVAPDLNKALRKRDGADRVDPDQILSALNGVYLVATVRDCRDSLAVNALFDQVWSQIGQALEIHIERGLENLRQNPADKNASARLDAGIKMAELRFNAEYAEVLRRAKETAERRFTPQG
ncbi:MAG: hypothetical protein ABIO40_12860 [Devosia sp.]